LKTPEFDDAFYPWKKFEDIYSFKAGKREFGIEPE
jgi:hypothetical protein